MTLSWHNEIKKHHHRLVVFLLSKGVPLSDAKDVANETWTQLMCKHREGELPHLELPGLAFQHALFLVSKQRRQRALFENDAQHIESATDSHEAQAQARQSLVKCAHELQKLPLRKQEVMSLVIHHSGRDAQKAQIVGISLQRFRQIVSQTRALLRTAMQEASK
jgi:DNA-directed RNA polymerase specialized sigma24 family protein